LKKKMSGSFMKHRQLSVEKLQQLLTWYKIRDMLFGHNHVKQDIKKALELAASCEYPDAVWLTKLFAGRDVNTIEQAGQVFLGFGFENDPSALCFAAVLGGTDEEVRRCADDGHATAQSMMAWRTHGYVRFLWAHKSAAQDERNGYFWLACCYRDGSGCEKDVHLAKENYMIAGQLGRIDAMLEIGHLLERTAPQRFFWFGSAAASGSAVTFLNEMFVAMSNFNAGSGPPDVVFAIGRALKGNIDKEKKTIFGSIYDFASLVVPANQAVQFYMFQLQSYRKAVDTWTIIALRNRVVKDIRKLIGKIIWDFRENAEFQ
jgi:hypothetical protein